MSRLLALSFVLFPCVVQAQAASVALSGDLIAGSTVSITWQGPNGQNDWVGLAPVGSPGSQWAPGAWSYTSAGNPVSVPLPAAGAYELRYVTGGSAVLAAVPIQVAAPVINPAGAVTLSPLGGLIGGEMLSVGWTGPAGQGDWVGLAPVGSAGTAWVGSSYAYVSGANPVQVSLPIDGGSFELRYVTGQNVILAAIPITIASGQLPSVVLADTSAEPGMQFQIALGADAPRAAGDYLYIARAGAADGDYSGGYVTIPSAGPVTIAAPQDPGAWELRYVVTRGSSYLVVGRAALTVAPAAAK